MSKKAKRVSRTSAKKSGTGKTSVEFKAVIDDLVMGNRILYHQGVVDGYRPSRAMS